MNDYLSDLKASRRLIEKIRQFYIYNGISTENIRFWVDIEHDNWGSKIYCIRSNIINNVTTGRLEFAAG